MALSATQTNFLHRNSLTPTRSPPQFSFPDRPTPSPFLDKPVFSDSEAPQPPRTFSPVNKKASPITPLQPPPVPTTPPDFLGDFEMLTAFDITQARLKHDNPASRTTSRIYQRLCRKATISDSLVSFKDYYYSGATPQQQKPAQFPLRVILPKALQEKTQVESISIPVTRTTTIQEVTETIGDRLGGDLNGVITALFNNDYMGALVVAAVVEPTEENAAVIMNALAFDGGKLLFLSLLANVEIHLKDPTSACSGVLLHGLNSVMALSSGSFFDVLYSGLRVAVESNLLTEDNLSTLVDSLVNDFKTYLQSALEYLPEQILQLFAAINRSFAAAGHPDTFFSLFTNLIVAPLTTYSVFKIKTSWKYNSRRQTIERGAGLLRSILLCDEDSFDIHVFDAICRERAVWRQLVLDFLETVQPKPIPKDPVSSNPYIERNAYQKFILLAQSIFSKGLARYLPIIHTHFLFDYPAMKKAIMAVQPSFLQDFHLRLQHSLIYLKVAALGATPLDRWPGVGTCVRENIPVAIECVDNKTYERDKLVSFQGSVITGLKPTAHSDALIFFRREAYFSTPDVDNLFDPIEAPYTTAPYPNTFPQLFFIRLVLGPEFQQQYGLRIGSTVVEIHQLCTPRMIIETFMRNVRKLQVLNFDDILLKICGHNEFLLNEQFIGNYSFVRQILRRSGNVQLEVVYKSPTVLEKMRQHDRSDQLEAQWRLKRLPIVLPQGIPHSSIASPFAFFVTTVTLMPPISPACLFVEATIFLGTTQLASARSPLRALSTTDRPRSTDALPTTISFNHWLYFKELLVKDIPYGAVISFVLIETPPRPAKNRVCAECERLLFNGVDFDKKFCSCSADGEVLCRTHLPLFDYRGVMSFTSDLPMHRTEMLPGGIPSYENVSEPLGTISVKIPSNAVILYQPPPPPPVSSHSPPPCSIDPSTLPQDVVALCTRTDPLRPLTPAEQRLIWSNVPLIVQTPSLKSNPTVLLNITQSVPWGDAEAVQSYRLLLETWPLLPSISAVKLLDPSIGFPPTRAFAVRCLEQCDDEELQQLLLQLAQALKFEVYPRSALAEFLLQRSLRSRSIIGTNMFWLLKSELHMPESQQRFAVILEAYLMAAGTQRNAIQKTLEFCNKLSSLYTQQSQAWKDDRRMFLQELDAITIDGFLVPYNMAVRCGRLLKAQCKVLDSLRKPLLLTFENADPNGENVRLIFKKDDDLRQDMLALKILEAMDRMWQKEGYDMRMRIYQVISLGNAVGMIEVVLGSETIAAIQKQLYGGTAAAAFHDDPLYRWLRKNNKNDSDFMNAQTNFIYSCAGYCVATYVLGVGDRHNDNILLCRTGHLVHIDFGHILGNVEKWKGIKRETAPFVLTKEFVYVMGGRASDKFTLFVKLCCDIFLILRRNSQGLLNLLTMMLYTGIPELKKMDDLSYMLNSLVLELTEDEARAFFEKQINVSLDALMTRVNNAIHILAHPDV